MASTKIQHLCYNCKQPRAPEVRFCKKCQSLHNTIKKCKSELLERKNKLRFNMHPEVERKLEAVRKSRE